MCVCEPGLGQGRSEARHGRLATAKQAPAFVLHAWQPNRLARGRGIRPWSPSRRLVEQALSAPKAYNPLVQRATKNSSDQNAEKEQNPSARSGHPRYCNIGFKSNKKSSFQRVLHHTASCLEQPAAAPSGVWPVSWGGAKRLANGRQDRLSNQYFSFSNGLHFFPRRSHKAWWYLADSSTNASYAYLFPTRSRPVADPRQQETWFSDNRSC